MEKLCSQCGKLYFKNKKYSSKQWEKTIYCSLKCSGKSRVGKPVSEKTKKKLSIAHKGTKKPWAGRYKHTKEQNLKTGYSVRKAYAENWEEITEKISRANKGRKWTESHRKNCENALRLRPNYRGGAETRKARKSFYEQKRELRKRINGGTHSFTEWEEIKKKYGYICPCCLKKEPEISLTEDHILPIAMGGLDNIENIQPLCRNCNSRKNNKYERYENKNI